MSNILHGCESRFNGDLRPIEKLYNWGIKQLLGVRVTTCTEVCHVELGYPPLKAIVLSTQRKLYQRLWEERRDMFDDPWAHTVRLPTAHNTTIRRAHINNLIYSSVDDIAISTKCMRRSIANSTSSRRQNYLLINSSLTVHDRRIQMSE